MYVILIIVLKCLVILSNSQNCYTNIFLIVE